MVPRTSGMGISQVDQDAISQPERQHQVSYMKYDAGLGTLIAAVDPNGLAMQWSYDGFGQPVMELGPDGTKTTVSRVRSKDAGLQGDWWGTTVTTNVDGGALTRTSLDSFGRPTHVRSK